MAYFFLVLIIIFNCYVYFKISDMLERLEERLTDIEILYVKMQQYYRNDNK